MCHRGTLRKMKTALAEKVEYYLHLGDSEAVAMHELVGKEIKLTWQNEIYCVVCGNKIKKSFAGGSCYTCFMGAPENSECIIRPELCEAHLGRGLRDADWDNEHHNVPHFVYLALTDAVKVGVTRYNQIPTRWIDQGAWQAIRFAEVPYRQLAGEIEVALKGHVTDKTNWRNMLRDLRKEGVDLADEKYDLADLLDEDYQDFISDNDEVVTLNYPVIQYPAKVTSRSFDKTEEVGGTLMGIRGQYLIFEDGGVINLRKFGGYVVELKVGDAPAKAPTLFD